MSFKRKTKKLMNNPKLFFSDMLTKHHKKINMFKPVKKNGKNQFTVVSAVYGVEKYLNDYFESMVNQTLDFKRHIHLIMVDDGSLDSSAIIIKKWAKKYPNNITYLYKENGGQGSARNLGIKHVKTKWVTFVDPDDFVDRDYFYEVDSFIDAKSDQNLGFIGCNFIFYFEDRNQYKETHPLGYKFKKEPETVSCKDLKKNIQMAVNSTIFLTDVIKSNNVEFDVRVKPNFEDSHFIAMYLYYVANYQAAFLKKAKYYYRKREDGTSAIDGSWKDKRVFIDKLIYGHHSIIDFYIENQGYVPVHIQRQILYDISWYMKSLIRGDKILDILTDEEVDTFFELLKKSFRYIETKVIIDFELSGIWFLEKAMMVGALKNEPIPSQISYVEKIDRNKNLVLFSYISYFDDQVSFRCEDKEIAPVYIKEQSYYARKVFLGKRRYYWVPIESTDKEIALFINGTISRLTTKSKRYNRPISYSELIEKLPKNKGSDFWILMDRDVQADDNAEHLYRYIKQKDPSKEIYFALRKTSHDWNRLQQEGFNLLDFGSSEHEEKLRDCNRIISSHADRYINDYLKDHSMLEKSFVFLQHGVTKDDMSGWFNSKKNMDLLITSTIPEYNSIVSNQSNYIFSEKDVKLTGFPRYDSIWDKLKLQSSEKFILIMPTWRQALVGDIIGVGNSREKNELFESSSYLKYWKSFLHNEKLSKLIDKYGFKLIFAPHKNMEMYLDSFELPDYIECWRSSPENSIQDLFLKSSFMVTDYSSVAFEMAYLNKSTIYYQFDEDEVFSGGHIYKKGYFDYEKHGFGPKVTCEDQLLEKIEALCLNEGEIDDLYLQRIKNTFKYQDSNNCERVYQAICDLDKTVEVKSEGSSDADNSNQYIKNWSLVQTSLLSKIQVLQNHRFDSSYAYCAFLKYACDIGRLDIPYLFQKIDKDIALLEIFKRENREIQRIFDFSLNTKILDLQKRYSQIITDENKLGIKDEFFEYFNRLDKKKVTHMENMILSFLLNLMIIEAKEVLTESQSLDLFTYFSDVKNCSDIRRGVGLLLLIELSMANGLKEFFKFKKQFYNHVNSIFSKLIYNDVLDESSKDLFTHRFLRYVKNINDFKMTRKRKVAICISGKFRNHVDALKSIKRDLVDPLDADVYIHTWDEASVWSGLGGAPNYTRVFGWGIKEILPNSMSSLSNLAKYFPQAYPILKLPLDKRLEDAQVFDLLNPKQVIIDSEDDFVNSLGDLSGFTKSRGSTNQIKMFYGMKQSFDMALREGSYDYIIRCRPDWKSNGRVDREAIEKLENNIIYSNIHSGVVLSDALFSFSSSMAYNFSQFVGYMFEMNKLSPFDNYPLYDAHNLMTAWMIENNYSYGDDFIRGKIQPNQVVPIPGLKEALESDYSKLNKSDKSMFKDFVEFLIKRNG